MKEVRFFVKGVPSPGGSKSAFCLKKNGVYTGRAVVVDAGGKKTKLWRQDVAAAAVEAMHVADLAPLEGALELELIFHLTRPQSHFVGKVRHHLRAGMPMFPITRPDVGKLAKSTQDALTGIVWHDDAQVVKESHEKVYSDQSGAWIVVRESE